MNSSGLIKGDEVRNAMMGPQGNAVVSIDTITAMVPQAQNGVNAPKATLPVIETPAFLAIARFNLSGSTYTLMAAATRIPIARTGALCTKVFKT
jgi:hypothetical protein